jgi:mono/diheme cytochrome c family protein
MKTHLISASLNSASVKARTFIAAMLFGSASLLVACGEPTNPAADYLATADSGSTSTVTPPVTPPASSDGDAANGKTLVSSNCSSCHGTTMAGAVSKQLLNASAVSKLAGAPVSQPAFHGSASMKVYFEGQNLKDISAACAAIPE